MSIDCRGVLKLVYCMFDIDGDMGRKRLSEGASGDHFLRMAGEAHDTTVFVILGELNHLACQSSLDEHKFAALSDLYKLFRGIDETRLTAYLA